MSKKKIPINEATISTIFDKILDAIRQGHEDRLIRQLEKDPELRQSMDDLKKSTEKVKDGLENYLKKFE